MNPYQKVASKMVARKRRPNVGQDVKDFAHGYTRNPRVPKNNRLWSPTNSSWMFPSKRRNR